MTINLHAVVRGVVHAVHPDETVTLLQSTGQENIRGVITPTYAGPQTVTAQIQSLSADELRHDTDASRTGLTRKAYLFSPAGMLPPAGVIRPIARNGDFVRRADGTWWLVTALTEDFTAAGWVCINMTLQITAPEGVENA